MRKTFFIFLTLLALGPGVALAQGVEIMLDKQTVLKAKVVEIKAEEESEILDTGIKNKVQTLEAQILEGENTGKTVKLTNDYLKLKEGEVFYILETVRYNSGDVLYYVYDKYRLNAVFFFVGLFILFVFMFGGMQGVRGLLALIGSMLLIVFVLMPGILEGYSPVFITIAVSSLIIVLGSYVTHGFNRTTSSAVVGMIVTVLLTGVLAYFAVRFASLSGFESEEAVYLNWNTRGTIDFVGLLFGGIMIGLLGVLYDVAIGQAVSVEELREAGIKDRKIIFRRVIRMGREHIGALVNTLAIAYVGASLPLLLLFYSGSNSSILEILNREVFATEIVRTMVGSIGLILAVPITSFISTYMLVKNKKG